jgi:hypothetical protein
MIIIKCDRCRSTDDVKREIAVGNFDTVARGGFYTLYGPFEMCTKCLRELKNWLYPAQPVESK